MVAVSRLRNIKNASEIKKNDEISPRWVTKLNKVYGDESWRDLYSESPQVNLFGEIELGREPGVDGLIRIYKNKLKSLLGDRFLDQRRLLKNSNNSTLFAFMFFVGNSAGITSAKRIAKHILDHL